MLTHGHCPGTPRNMPFVNVVWRVCYVANTFVVVRMKFAMVSCGSVERDLNIFQYVVCRR